MRVRDIMQRHVTVVSEDDGLGLAQQRLRAGQVMSAPKTVREDTPLREAVALLLSGQSARSP